MKALVYDFYQSYITRFDIFYKLGHVLTQRMLRLSRPYMYNNKLVTKLVFASYNGMLCLSSLPLEKHIMTLR